MKGFSLRIHILGLQLLDVGSTKPSSYGLCDYSFPRASRSMKVGEKGKGRHLGVRTALPLCMLLVPELVPSLES